MDSCARSGECLLYTVHRSIVPVVLLSGGPGRCEKRDWSASVFGVRNSILLLFVRGRVGARWNPTTRLNL